MFIRDDNSQVEKLRDMGFSPTTIRRLCILRKRYAKSEMDQPALDKHHLEFARWLVLHHKLTEEIN